MIEKKKSNEWYIFLTSLIILFFALIFPAVSFSNSAGSINLYLSGIVSVNIYGYGSAAGIVSNPEIVIPSILAMTSLVISLFTVSIYSHLIKNDIKNFKNLKLRYLSLANAILLMVPTIIWIIQFDQIGAFLPEEILEMGYENLWEIFAPSFGLIGIFIASIIMIGGTFFIQINYSKILEKLIPSRTERREELDNIYQVTLIEISKIKNTAKECYFEEGSDINFLNTLTDVEQRKYNHLNRRLANLKSVLQNNSK